jgi:hypothetical protein
MTLDWQESHSSWDNRQADLANVKARIDRGFTNDLLFDIFFVPKA